MSHTPGPWMLATSNSWRRIVTAHKYEHVCEPIKQPDGHPDLFFRNPDDALLIVAAPDLLDALSAIVQAGELLSADDVALIFADDSVLMQAARAAIAKAEA